MLKAVFFFILVALAAGLEDANVDDPDVVSAASSEVVTKRPGGAYWSRVAKILNAQKQERDNRTTYQLVVILGLTICKKDEYTFEEASNCDFQDRDSTYRRCNVLIDHYQDGSYKLLNQQCTLASKDDI